MSVTPKQLAKITGKLSSMHVALGPIVRLFSRNIYHDIESRFSWHEAKCISKETADKLKKKNGLKIKIPITATHLNLDHKARKVY